jgi:UDP:flavonoid glycosyltransferase YjiC (YdhE family)
MLAVPYVPHGEVFPRALANIHQGGIGTTAQALRSGRPMLVVPHAFDQPDNAARVSNLGVGRTLFPKRYTATRAVEHIRALLENPSYAQRAAEVGAIVRVEDGVQRACDALEIYLATSPGAPATA